MSRISPGKDDLDNDRKDDKQKSGSEGGVTEIIQHAADSKVVCGAPRGGGDECVIAKEKPQHWLDVMQKSSNPYSYTDL